MTGSWSQYPGLVIKQITKIDRIIIRRRIINNILLPSGKGDSCILDKSHH